MACEEERRVITVERSFTAAKNGESRMGVRGTEREQSDGKE